MAAAYFSFVTLTTIGFGDLSPMETFTGIGKPDAGFTEYMQMIFATFYCGIGLALVSMCISLIQEQVARQANLMAGSKDEVIELDVIEIVPRRPNFFEIEEKVPDIAVVPVVVPDTTSIEEDRPETAGTLPGETMGDDE